MIDILELRSQRTPARFEMALYRSGDRSDGNAVVYTAGEGLAIESRSDTSWAISESDSSASAK